MNTLYNNRNFIFSIFIKIFLLFFFLSCFFYIIIQKQVTSGLSSKLSEIIFKSYNNMDDKSKDIVTRLYLASSLNNETELEKSSIKYNNLIKMLNMTILIFFIVSPIIVYYISRFIFYKKIPIIQIITFNVLLYIIVGILEYIFFMKISSKYIPITNSEIIILLKNYIN